MTSTDKIAALKMRGRAGLLAAVPALLGFHPQESLVMICMSGPRRRVGPVIRVDADDRSPGLRTMLTGHAERYADEVALVLYTELPGPPALLDLMLAALTAADIDVLDALLIRDGRVWPTETLAGHQVIGASDDDDGHSFPIPDSDDPQVQAMAAAAALHGRGILPDRAALARSIAGPTGELADRSAEAFRRAADVLLRTLESEEMTGPDPVALLADRAADNALFCMAKRGRLDGYLSAQLGLLVSDVAARDALLSRAVVELEAGWLPMLISAAGQVLDHDAAALCCLLAVTAYRHGDGALAQVAVDRCLAAEPDYRLGHLLLAAMASGLPPQQLAQLALGDPPARCGRPGPFSPGTAR